jgi:Tfp pilus assembly protein FimT
MTRWPVSLLDQLDDERGTSLVELLVGLSIAAMLVGFLGTSVFQFFNVTRWGNARMAVSAQLQNATIWLGRDAAEAETFSAGAGTTYGTFAWPAGDPAFRYRYDAPNHSLVRDLIEGGSVQSTNTVARHIQNQADVSFAPSSNTVAVHIQATSGAISDSIDLTLAMRVR